ncbi:YggS family pyridoxal phosphate-dependent enzyme [Roseospirillum parvum]|uniref:Pyridoxal phosphate homeostasis protein n=1 Tax=Roseospirillum parvum TaxID=83401 RepID=A0A1G8DTX8_9PROT|nr:YggS family pyridoxal phosphate-dependent enzyme [Roseospirillum parvum]SDH61144.1 hypothetical protein SAMN05421742_108119 [Roseospirillum parvum]
MNASVADNLSTVRASIAEAARAAGRSPESVTLVAVSKVHGAERAAQALEAGQRVFGENRVQEAQTKWPDLKRRFPEARLHLIGPLQTNKVRPALELFDVIETVDRPRLAKVLGEALADRPTRPDLLVQVNTGQEPQKAGIDPAEADDFLAYCRNDCGLTIQGLMCIPPIDEEPALHFALLREIARRHDLPWLSMGMSDDYPTAIAMGATHVRIGTAIFGHRPPKT